MDWSKAIERLTRVESLLSLLGMIVSSGIFAWLWQQIVSFGWPAAILLGVGTAAALLLIISLFLISIRYFRSNTVLQDGIANSGSRDENRILINDCRQMVARYLDKHLEKEDFRDYAVRQVEFMKISKHLPADTMEFFTNRRKILAEWDAGAYPALAHRLLRDLDHLEDKWKGADSSS